MCDSDTFTQKNLYVKENISIFAQLKQYKHQKPIETPLLKIKGFKE